MSLGESTAGLKAVMCGMFYAVQSCKGGRVQQVEQLIFYGADINQQNAGGNTALHVCAANNQVINWLHF